MEEAANRNSMKLDFEAVRLCDSKTEIPKETYKQIDTDNLDLEPFGNVVNNNLKKMVRDKDGNNIEDGADEKMLGSETERLAQKDEVKFITGDRQNGDAKVDIGLSDKGFTGMTKEELMKYANDPFWVRLRWIFFILFWGLWIGMLVGAVLIIIHAPKCAAPTPLTWFKQGPLVDSKLKSFEYESIVNDIKGISPKGVIFELPEDETYMIDEDKIKKLVDTYNSIGVTVILDITPNFVTKNNSLFQQALVNETLRSAFVWSGQRQTVPTNWLSKINGSAWHEIKPENFVLSQFGDGHYDLQFKNELVQDMFITQLRLLCKLGVKGFRIINAEHLIINTEFNNEIEAGNFGTFDNEYNYWTHKETTYQDGLDTLFYRFGQAIANETNNDGFISVRNNIIHPEKYLLKAGKLSLDLPVFGSLTHKLASDVTEQMAKHLKQEIENIHQQLGSDAWVQWQYDIKSLTDHSRLGVSEYNMFMMLLPGVPVSTLNGFKDRNNVTDIVTDLMKLRNSASYMHGTFEFYATDNNVAAYTRIKSGNPGYFIALNPTNAEIEVDFTFIPNMPDQMTVHMLSKHYNVTDVSEKTKLSSTGIKISAHSVIILTYVPKSSD